MSSDDEDFIPKGSSNLAALFAKNQVDVGNASLTYTAPKKRGNASVPKPSKAVATATQSTKLELIAYKVVEAYRLANNSYKSEGKIGAALLGNKGARLYQLLLYRGQADHVTSAAVTQQFKFKVQSNRYATFCDKHNELWSIHFRDLADAVDFTREVVLARWWSAATKCEIIQDLEVTDENAAKVERGNSVALEYCIRTIEDGHLGEALHVTSAVVSVTVDDGWTEGLVGINEGTRRAILLPPTQSNLWKVPSNIEAWLLLELHVLRIVLPDELSTTRTSDLYVSSGNMLTSRDEDAKEESTPNVDSVKQSLISRMARMGQPMLVLAKGDAPADSGSDVPQTDMRAEKMLSEGNEETEKRLQRLEVLAEQILSIVTEKLCCPLEEEPSKEAAHSDLSGNEYTLLNLVLAKATDQLETLKVKVEELETVQVKLETKLLGCSARLVPTSPKEDSFLEIAERIVRIREKATCYMMSLSEWESQLHVQEKNTLSLRENGNTEEQVERRSSFSEILSEQVLYMVERVNRLSARERLQLEQVQQLDEQVQYLVGLRTNLQEEQICNKYADEKLACLTRDEIALHVREDKLNVKEKILTEYEERLAKEKTNLDKHEEQVAVQERILDERKVQLNCEETKLVALEKDLTDIKEELDERDRHLAEEEIKLGAKKEQLCEERLKLEKKELEDREKLLGARDKELADKEKQLAQEKTKLEDRDLQFSIQETTLAEREERLKLEENELEDQEKLLAAQDKKLAEREKQLAQEKTKLEDRDLQFSIQETTLAEREERLDLEKTEIEDQEKLLKAQNIKMAEKEKMLAVEKRKLKDRLFQLSVQETDLAEREERLNSRKNELEGRENQLSAQLAEREKQLTREKTKLEDRDLQFSVQETTLAEREERLALEKCQLEEREKQLGAHDKKLAERAKQLAQEKIQFNIQDRTLAECKEQLVLEKHKLEELEKQLGPEKHKLEELEKQLGSEKHKLEELEKHLAAKERKLSEREEKLNEEKNKLRDREELFCSQELKLAKQEKQLAQEKCKLEEQVAQLSVLEKQFTEQAESLAEQQKLCEQDQVLWKGREDQLSELETKLFQPESRLVQLETACSDGDHLPTKLFDSIYKRLEARFPLNSTFSTAQVCAAVGEILEAAKLEYCIDSKRKMRDEGDVKLTENINEATLMFMASSKKEDRESGLRVPTRNPMLSGDTKVEEAQEREGATESVKTNDAVGGAPCGDTLEDIEDNWRPQPPSPPLFDEDENDDHWLNS